MNIKLEINNYDHEGRGIAKYNGKIVFVPKTIKGEIVEANIIKEKKNYCVANVVNFLKTSNERINPACPYYDKCGGCNFLHMDYSLEEKIKVENVINILKKYASIDIFPKILKTDNECNYRNKITLKIENNKWGYYNSESHNFVQIENCQIAKKSINQIITDKKYLNIPSGTITIRSNYNDEIILKITTPNKYKIDINSLIKNNKIVGIIVNDKIFYGENSFIERVNHFLFKVNIDSFFQVNLDILNKIFDLIGKQNYQTVADVYCGVGTLGIAIKKDKLYGIEIVQDAVQDAIVNSKINKQNNNMFLLGDASKLEKINDKIDTIIIDPPRSGLNKKTLNTILNFNPANIIYMSCNPHTLARDLNVLKENYKIKDFYICEMFPRTKHVESVVLLYRKSLEK
jgi:23S rRNA (uracil1939-C5)-methyltransferase